MKIKNKKLPIILGCLGVVAVSSIGFATWLVGHEKDTASNNIDVVVNGTEDHGMVLECILADNEKGITLGEFETIQNNDGKAIGVTENNGDLTVGLKTFKLHVSKTYYRANKITGVSFEVKYNNKALPTKNILSGDKFGRTQGDATYIDFANTTINKTNFGEATEDSAGWNVYDLSKVAGFESGLKFKYGSVFGDGENTTPAKFYNTNIPNYDSNKTFEENKEVLEKRSLASTELADMKTAFSVSSAKISITAKVTFSE